MVNPKKKDLFVGYETGSNGTDVVTALMSTGLYEKGNNSNEETLKIVTVSPEYLFTKTPTKDNWLDGIVWMFKRLWVYENLDDTNWFYQNSEFKKHTQDVISNPESIGTMRDINPLNVLNQREVSIMPLTLY